jgi:D-alanine transaminase
MNIVYLNKQFIEKEDARVSIMDRGFLFADAIYEVIPFFNGHAIEKNNHLDRLNRNASACNLSIKDRDYWNQIIDKLIKKNNLKLSNFSIYFQITRGSHPTRSHAPPIENTTTEVAFCMPLKTIDPYQNHHAILIKDTRHLTCHLKTTNLFANTQLKQAALKQNAIEAILHLNNYITECTSSNVFIIKENHILTPSLDHNILPGITRNLVIQLIKQTEHPCSETSITTQEVQSADEIWVTSSSKGICPITKLDNKPVGAGSIGPVWKRVHQLYSELIRSKETLANER